MDRSREARRGTMAATANGLARRRQRSSSLRDSPEEDGGVELQETARLRDRSSKKERHRDRDRDRSNSRNKRRRGDRLLHGSNREGEESSEESVDDEEEEDEEAAGVRLPQVNPSSSAVPNHQRKSFPAKVVRAPATWKAADEMIGVSVPRKARSASAKRSHECWISGTGGSGEQILRQASTSPARQTAGAGPTAPISPSSSNTSSVRKKMKPIGAKHRPPKISKTSSSIQEIEIEVAEVLYGLTRQFPCPTNQETVATTSQKHEPKDINGSSNDAKSRVSSPISASPSSVPQPNSSSSANPSTAIAPKRKRPRPVKFEEDGSPANFAVPNAPSTSAMKTEVEQQAKVEISSPRMEKPVENGGGSLNLGSTQIPAVASEVQEESVIPESNLVPDSKPLEEYGAQEVTETNEEVSSPLKEAPSAKLDVDLDDTTTTKAESTTLVVENRVEDTFKIDLMVPPSGKSSPERDGVVNFETYQKPEAEMVSKMEILKAEEKMEGVGKQEVGEVRLEEKKTEIANEEGEPRKLFMDRNVVRGGTIDLQVDLEKQDKESAGGKQQMQAVQKQQLKAIRSEAKTEKAAQPASMPLQMTVPGWPGGIPPLGYMGQVPSLQAVASMDGSTGSSTAMQPPHFLLPQPRPKRCATHFYIAQNVYCHQQFTRMNPFWPPPVSGSAPMFGSKPYNLNVVPSTESSAMLGNPLQGSLTGRNMNSVQEKGPVPTFPGPVPGPMKEKTSAATFMEANQRQQLMLQQAPQPPSANNMLAPAFIFPLGQQQTAAAPRPGAPKSTTTNVSPLISAANSGAGSAASSGSAAANAMSFNYANLPPSEAQYWAILQNNGYPLPVPAHVGAPPPYRGGNHTQPMPFFSGSFYSPQMIHPSQLQQQQVQSQPPQVQQGHQKTSTSSGSSSSQKHQQQRLQGGGSNGRDGSSHSFPASKQRQPMLNQQNQHLPPHQARQLEENISEDSPSTADSRASHAHKNVVYNHNFAMPIHPQNFTLMSPAALGGGNHTERHAQQHGLKGGMELVPSQAFPMSFASFGGATPGAAPGLDFSNHTVFQSLPEVARHSYQMATSAAQQKKPHPEEVKTDSINPNASGEDERKMTSGKAGATGPHSITFSRSDNDPSISTILGNSVVDCSNRTLNLIPAPANGNRASRSTIGTSTSTTTAATTINPPSSQQQQQQQLINLQKQQQQQLQQQLAARSKSATSNSSAYSDRLPTMAKFPNGVSVFPQALIQGNSPNQSPQWKASGRIPPTANPSPSPSMPSVKNLPQQQARPQPALPATGHTQISFGVNPKPTSSAQQIPSNNPAQSSGSLVGSPPSSISKGAGGSPRTSTTSKPGPTATLSSHPSKNSPSTSSRKSSPVSNRPIPSILGNSHVNSAQSPTSKPQNQHQSQQQQQQLQKQSFQQAQFLFSNAFRMQAQSQSSQATTYQKRHSEQQQQHQNSSGASSSGMLSLCSSSLTLAGTPTTDPAKAVAAAAAAASNLKGMPPPNLLHAAQFAAQSTGNPHQLMSAAFPYIQTIPAMPVKSTEQKPAGNDNLHASCGSLRRDDKGADQS